MDNFQQNANPNIGLINVLQALQNQIFAKLNCMRIGIITKILENGEVVCQITNKQLLKTNPDGSSVVSDYPPIYAKVWYMGSGATGINYPLTENTPCLMLFNDREFDSYFTTGEISPLADTRMHALSDCICIPLYYQQAGTAFNITTSGELNITAKTINLNAGTININGNLIINGVAFTDHKHSNGNEGANTGGVV